MKFNVKKWNEKFNVGALDEIIESLDNVFYHGIAWLLNKENGGCTDSEYTNFLDVRYLLKNLRTYDETWSVFMKTDDIIETVSSLDYFMYLYTLEIIQAGIPDNENADICNVRTLLDLLRECVKPETTIEQELFNEKNLCHSFLIQENLMEQFQKFKERKQNVPVKQNGSGK